MLWRKKQFDDAAEHFDAALALRVKLLLDDPQNTRARSELVAFGGEVGDKFLKHGDAAKAKTYYAEAVANNEKLAAADNSLDVHRALGINYYRLATAYLRLGDSANADQCYGKCLAVRERVHKTVPTNDRYQIELLTVQARCGQHQKAAALAAALQMRYAENPGILIDLACGYALCSAAVLRGKKPDQLTAADRAEQDRYRDLALAALRQAKQNGYKDAANLEVQPDLDPIRETPEFKSFVRELAAGPEA